MPLQVAESAAADARSQEASVLESAVEERDAPPVADYWVLSIQDDWPVEWRLDDRFALGAPRADSELPPDDHLAEVPAGGSPQDGWGAALLWVDLLPPGARSQRVRCPADWPAAWMRVDPVARHWRDGLWLESPVCQLGRPLPWDAPQLYSPDAGSALHSAPAAVPDARPAPAAVSQKAQAVEAAFSWRRLAGLQLPQAAQSRDPRLQPSRQARSRGLERPQPSR